jgi:hypothetical protein
MSALPIERDVMNGDVNEMTLEELLWAARTLRVWIRDVKMPKNARLAVISKEIQARKREKGDITHTSDSVVTA